MLPWPLLSLAFKNTRGYPTGHFMVRDFFPHSGQLESVADELPLAYVPRICVCAHLSTFKSWRLVRSPRGACCVSSLFFQHRKSGTIKCPECYTSASYIHLRLLERFESCSTRSVLTVTRHAVANCPNYPEVLKRFFAYLERAREQSWSDPKSTIVGVSSVRL